MKQTVEYCLKMSHMLALPLPDRVHSYRINLLSPPSLYLSAGVSVNPRTAFLIGNAILD